MKHSENRLGPRLVRFGTAVAFLAFSWWAVSKGFRGGQVLPGPAQAAGTFLQALATKAFWDHFLASALRVILSMTAAWAVAFPLGIFMGSHKTVDAWLAPLVFLTFPVPKIVFLPVVLLLFGLGDFSKVFLIALIVGYQVLVAVRDGVSSLNPKYVDSVKTLGAGPWPLFRHVFLPAALPHGFTALRLGTGTGIAVLFFVESFATSRGLGYLIMDAWGRLDYRGMVVGILGMSFLGAALFEIIEALEKVLCRWQGARQRS
ncbi:ABC transporter permease [Desulfosoma caldarium]|uniref:NitT/TauT family transport system permease protein n=1 Tax=Desulfosoma caldarium TaxID=610254 RepID=A0A3N1VKL7_9BACT|nr:ABC transporter permease [Desulfosoma caldarium]ROR01538.1 NitT/TauT family transport system permease protein [Desulfosoma caldarium]